MIRELRTRDPALFRRAYRSLPREVGAAVDARLAIAGSEIGGLTCGPSGLARPLCCACR
jgi:hypothetical protein